MEYAYMDGTVVGSRKDVKANDGKKHPNRILSQWTEAELKSIGVLPFVRVTENRDTRYYDLADEQTVITDDAVTVTLSGTERDLAACKTEAVLRAKMKCGENLRATDWHFIRKIETGADVPANIISARNQYRTDCNTRETAIGTAETIDQLATAENA